jgi:GxxExxY protein
MSEIILKDKSYKVIGLCMEVHRQLGHGFKEIVYKDALEIELAANNIPFTREKMFDIEYKGILLPRKYWADFVVYDSIILEVKAAPIIVDAFLRQTLNYLKASKLKLGIVANFGEPSLTYKRVVL